MIASRGILRLSTCSHTVRHVKFIAARYAVISVFSTGKTGLYSTTPTFRKSTLEFGDESGLENGFKQPKFEIPQRIRQKVISAADAVSLVNDGDTISVSGFVCQGKPDAMYILDKLLCNSNHFYYRRSRGCTEKARR